MSYGSPEPLHLYPNPFNSSRRNSSVGSPPHSELAEQFKKNLQLSKLSNLSTSVAVPDEKLVTHLKNSVSLQAWGLKKSEATFRDVEEQLFQPIQMLEKMAVKATTSEDAGIEDMRLHTLRTLQRIRALSHDMDHTLKVLDDTVKNNLFKEGLAMLNIPENTVKNYLFKQGLANSPVASEGQISDTEELEIEFINRRMPFVTKVTD
jgi:hypothetical protein